MSVDGHQPSEEYGGVKGEAPAYAPTRGAVSFLIP
jgi:hypothetical protein